MKVGGRGVASNDTTPRFLRSVRVGRPMFEGLVLYDKQSRNRFHLPGGMTFFQKLSAMKTCGKTSFGWREVINTLIRSLLRARDCGLFS